MRASAVSADTQILTRRRGRRASPIPPTRRPPDHEFRPRRRCMFSQRLSTVRLNTRLPSTLARWRALQVDRRWERKGYEETRNRPTSQSGVTSQSSDFPVSCQVTWPFFLAIPVSFLCLAGPCPGWLRSPAVARLGPGGLGLADSNTQGTHSQNSHPPSPRTR